MPGRALAHNTAVTGAPQDDAPHCARGCTEDDVLRDHAAHGNAHEGDRGRGTKDVLREAERVVGELRHGVRARRHVALAYAAVVKDQHRPVRRQPRR